MQAYRCHLWLRAALRHPRLRSRGARGQPSLSSLDEAAGEQKYPLTLVFCEDCKHIQIKEIVDPSLLFTNYAWETGVGTSILAYCRDFAETVAANAHVPRDGFVVDGLKRTLVALVMPPLKNYLPFFFLVLYSRWRNRTWKLSREQGKALLIGTVMVVSFTCLMSIWTSIDSWFYQHIPVPFGWALIFAALWVPKDCEKDPVHLGLLGLSYAFLALLTLNGSRNMTDTHRKRKQWREWLAPSRKELLG